MARESNATAKEIGLLVGLVRILRNWNKAGLASQTGMDKGRITKYEAGAIRPESATMARILSVARLSLRFPERVLPWLREILAAAVPDSEEPPEFAGAEGLAVRLGRMVTAVARPLLPRLRARLRSIPAAASQGSAPAREEEQAAFTSVSAAGRRGSPP
jgi:transcriptional regulator with XRE-family HTH domain